MFIENVVVNDMRPHRGRTYMSNIFYKHLTSTRSFIFIIKSRRDCMFIENDFDNDLRPHRGRTYMLPIFL